MRGADPESVFDGGEGVGVAGEGLEVKGLAGVVVSFQRRGSLHHATILTASQHTHTSLATQGEDTSGR